MSLMIHQCLFGPFLGIKTHIKHPKLGSLTHSEPSVSVKKTIVDSTLVSERASLSPSSEDDRNPGFVKVLMGLKVLISNSPLPIPSMGHLPIHEWLIFMVNV